MNHRLNDIHVGLTNSLQSLFELYVKSIDSKITDQIDQHIGCSTSEFRIHLEHLWVDDMSWQNFGPEGWKIEHIRPLSSFAISERKQQLVAFNWRNLQPKWMICHALDNSRYDPASEADWMQNMRKLGFDGELFPLFEEGHGGLI